MRINKDLADAIMMVSFIVLVLVGTTTFDNEVTKKRNHGIPRCDYGSDVSSSRHRITPKGRGRSLLVVSPLVSCCCPGVTRDYLRYVFLPTL
mgnify:FL=1